MVRYIKLISGEHIIGDMEKEGKVYKVKQPVQLLFDPNSGGGNFAPFGIGMKDGQTIDLREDVVMFDAELETDIANAYNSNFGNGIVVPTGLEIQTK